MSPSAFGRWCGLGAILGGLLFAAWGYMHGNDAPSYFAAIEDALGFVVPLLFLVGLAGLYARCRGRAGRLGGVGFVLGFVGSGLGLVNRFEVVHAPIWAYVVGARGWSPLLLIWLTWLLVGLTLVGITTIRTKALGGWDALPLATGLFGWVYYLTDSNSIVEAHSVHLAFGVLFSLSWVALGYALWSERGTPARAAYPRTC